MYVDVENTFRTQHLLNSYTQSVRFINYFSLYFPEVLKNVNS